MNMRRGVALVLVLWLLVLLIALAGTFVTISRTEYRQGVYARGSVQARYVAQAAIELAVARMLDPDPAARLLPDGRVYRFGLGPAQVAGSRAIVLRSGLRHFSAGEIGRAHV